MRIKEEGGLTLGPNLMSDVNRPRADILAHSCTPRSASKGAAVAARSATCRSMASVVQVAVRRGSGSCTQLRFDCGWQRGSKGLGSRPCDPQATTPGAAGGVAASVQASYAYDRSRTAVGGRTAQQFVHAPPWPTPA